MKKAIVISLNFNPGHTSHLLASYKQLVELDYNTSLYISKRFVPFLPPGVDFFIRKKMNMIGNFDVAFFLFPSIHNVWLIIKLKLLYRTRILYVFHEPINSLLDFYKAGFKIQQLLKLVLINIINVFIVLISDKILLPSHKAMGLYDNNKWYLNRNRFYLPLMYDSEVDNCRGGERRYFSYIGTIAADHSFDEYLNFVEWCIKANKLMELSFLIATKSSLFLTSRIKEMLNTKRLVIIEGKPLTDFEINSCFASSYVVWNAYKRSTQSGVIAKSFMFGTPAIVLKSNASEFVENGRNVVLIDDNHNREEIYNALKMILDKFDSYSFYSNECFKKCFYYRNFNSYVSKLLKRK